MKAAQIDRSELIGNGTVDLRPLPGGTADVCSSSGEGTHSKADYTVQGEWVGLRSIMIGGMDWGAS